ncbi:hydrocephalus-inducing protein homolog [Agelaius phoeniceus]|uniref:hydrocephalus-inducing protein homolog n=1 Tax=Agelaius phoeniceus TaxID=39638 RepID=UPI004054C205
MSSHRTMFVENRSNITAHFREGLFPLRKKRMKTRGGRESRLTLQLRGEGQGLLVEHSSHTLNLGNVFVNTPHVHEVKLMNQGALDAPFTYIPSATKVGFCFKFAPKEGIIAAGGSQSVQISFSATVLGSFEEEFQFNVAGSPRPAILTIKGSVTAPSLHFDLPELDFGDISFDHFEPAPDWDLGNTKSLHLEACSSCPSAGGTENRVTTPQERLSEFVIFFQSGVIGYCSFCVLGGAVLVK